MRSRLIADRVLSCCKEDILNNVLIIYPYCDVEPISEYIAYIHDCGGKVYYSILEDKKINSEVFPDMINRALYIKEKGEMIRIDCVLIFNDFTGYDAEYLGRSLRNIEYSKAKIVYIDYECNRLGVKYRRRIENKINQAILISPEEVIAINNYVFHQIKDDVTFRITTNEGTDIRFKKQIRAPISMEDLRTYDNLRMVQFPYGEVYFPIAPRSANGVIKIRSTMIEVVDGYANIPGYSESVPVCEFGIGTNRKMSGLKILPSYEKALGTCHFGFGSNIEFGGTIDCDYHFDVVLNDFELYTPKGHCSFELREIVV